MCKDGLEAEPAKNFRWGRPAVGRRRGAADGHGRRVSGGRQGAADRHGRRFPAASWGSCPTVRLHCLCPTAAALSLPGRLLCPVASSVPTRPPLRHPSLFPVGLPPTQAPHPRSPPSWALHPRALLRLAALAVKKREGQRRTWWPRRKEISEARAAARSGSKPSERRSQMCEGEGWSPGGGSR
ncbi:hypothetical protein PVAP13_5KG401407 [Panicum virgatum]|uniref:Uncharacterized protein n=1 Tax=Panicum virgatum TaxID=38727 RepID=A0A8T0SH43_PANVG|nr:hypothetical protein PVAP13_5KG401407 [Panicum virgatum]